MPLVTLRDLSVRFRGPSLFDSINNQIEVGDRIGLLGRNGVGKTTLMRLLAGQIEPDHGQAALQPGSKIALLPQEVPRELSGTVQQVVRTGITTTADDDSSEWEAEHRVDQILSRMELPANADVARMSVGLKRRVLLARALADEPDMLLLDEPTNHLDIEAVEWLEQFLLKWRGTLMFITHDRRFLRKLANRIWEIDRGQLFDWECDYDTFLKRKEEALAAEEKQQALFDKRLAEEEVWIRQGIKARRTRNEGRVRRLEAMRRERSQRRSATGTTNLQIQEGARSGNLVIQATDLRFQHAAQAEAQPILSGFSTTIMRGDKVGIIGHNGCGKTTLLKLLLGQLQPEAGSVRVGSNVEIAYFDQTRGQLNEEQTVEHEVADGYSTIEFQGNARHVLGYLQDFLFTPERARTQIKFLSGGERNRVLLAKLFAKTANLLVLDEPTNDLDAETLELLEEKLVEFGGTILLVSHDRDFLNQVATSTIAFEKIDGRPAVNEYVGGYDDWLAQSPLHRVPIVVTKPAAKTVTPESTKPTAAKKLTFKEQREFDSLPDVIAKLESEIAALMQATHDPAFYKQPGEMIAKHSANLGALENQLADTYHRWEELSNRAS